MICNLDECSSAWSDLRACGFEGRNLGGYGKASEITVLRGIKRKVGERLS